MINTSNKELLARNMMTASPSVWSAINLSMRVFLVKNGRKKVSSSSDVRPISIQNSLVSIYERALEKGILKFAIEHGSSIKGAMGSSQVNQYTRPSRISSIHSALQLNPQGP